MENGKPKAFSFRHQLQANRQCSGGTGCVPPGRRLGLVSVAAFSQATSHLFPEFCLSYLDTVGVPEIPSKTKAFSFIPLPLR